MRPFDIHVAGTIEDALNFLARHGDETQPLAGGTDLVVRLRDGRASPRWVLDLSRLDQLRTVTVAGTTAGEPRLCLGALTTFTQVIGSPVIARHAPLLAEACRTVGSTQVRNRGTIGGNCVTASPAGDSLPALLALEAELVLLSAAGERRVRAADFFSGPGVTRRRPDELLAYIWLSGQSERERSIYLKLGQRNALAISVISLALRLTCTGAAVAFGAVAPTPLRARRAEEALAGHALDSDTIARAAALAREEVSPITDIRATAEYRREMAAVLLKRGLERLWRDRP